MPAPKRAHLVETAARLFAKEGFKGVSIDRLLEEAGVAKMTLYKAFSGKDALIRATLHYRAAALADHIRAAVDRAGPNPRDRLLSVFDAMESWAERPDFNGCYFINALGEYGDPTRPEAEIARRYKEEFLTQLEDLCHATDQPDAADLAKLLFMLIDGATMARLTLTQRDSFARARAAAEMLLENYGAMKQKYY